MFAALPGLENVYLSGCCSGNAPEHPASSLTATSGETLGLNLKGRQKKTAAFTVKTNKSGQGKVGGRLQEQRQTDELRQRHAQVQLGPGGAEPGQQSCSHRTDAEAEW